MTAFKLTVPPSVEPVTLADCKSQARIDTSADDTLVTSLLTGARQWAEIYTGRAFITQTWQLWIDQPAMSEWWDGMRQGPVTTFETCPYILLPRPPLMSVNSVQSFDNTDTGTVWPSSNYYVDTIHEPGRLALRIGSVWPVAARLTNGICIEYVAGYGASGGNVPEPIKTAIRQLIAHWYENRGEAPTAPRASGGDVIQHFAPVPLVIQALLDPYRIRKLGN